MLIRDQLDSAVAGAVPQGQGRRPPYHVDREEIAEEQGWVARMVHLFRAESLDVQFEVCLFRLCVSLLSEIIYSDSTRSSEKL